MKRFLAVLAALLLTSAVTLSAKAFSYEACTKDHKVVSLVVDFEPMDGHDAGAHFSAAFKAMASQFNAAQMEEHDAFVAFISALDGTDVALLNGFPNGAPVATGASCR